MDTRDSGQSRPHRAPLRSRLLLGVAYALTLSRLAMAAAVWSVASDTKGVLALIAAAGITDVLDGWVARRADASRGPRVDSDVAADHARRGPGAWLDPFCDKVFVISLLAALWYVRGTQLLFLLLVGAREILQAPMVILYLSLAGMRHRSPYDFTADLAGKLTTLLQFLALAALFGRVTMAPVLAVTAGGVGIAAAGLYLRRAVLLMRARATRPS